MFRIYGVIRWERKALEIPPRASPGAKPKAFQITEWDLRGITRGWVLAKALAEVLARSRFTAGSVRFVKSIYQKIA
jgi:hypothetical protein